MSIRTSMQCVCSQRTSASTRCSRALCRHFPAGRKMLCGTGPWACFITALPWQVQLLCLTCLTCDLPEIEIKFEWGYCVWVALDQFSAIVYHCYTWKAPPLGYFYLFFSILTTVVSFIPARRDTCKCLQPNLTSHLASHSVRMHVTLSLNKT